MFSYDAEPEDLPEILTEEDRDTVALVRNNLGYFFDYENLYSTWLKMGNDFNVAHVRDGLAVFNRNIAQERKLVFDGIFTALETGLSKLGTIATAKPMAIRSCWS